VVILDFEKNEKFLHILYFDRYYFAIFFFHYISWCSALFLSAVNTD
jgi:hypothetical protein